MDLKGATYLLMFGAVVTAVVLARRRPAWRHMGHRPFATFMVLNLGAEIVRTTIAPHIYTTASGPPLEGWRRALFHLDEALLLAELAAMAWCGVVVFQGPRICCANMDDLGDCPRCLSAMSDAAADRARGRYVVRWRVARRWAWYAWVSAVAFAAAGYPTLRGDALRQFYLAAELLALLVCTGAFVLWLRRRETSFPTPFCVALCVVVEFVALGVTQVRGLFGAWPLAQAAYCALYLSLILFQGWWLWKTSRVR